ncbi:DUF4132 domain-containing protein [Escherichia coli]|nr:DUF4132 domain-containing protein [Escherichia coli]
MDKELPWLADNAQLELKYKKGKTPLSHRKWPGEPVPVITESIIQTLGDKLLQKAEKKKNIVWRYENFSLEWQSAITQAINLIGEHKPSIPARTMAALVCIAQNDSQQLLDEIVQQEGLEYATEVVIARQFITRCYESDPLLVTLQYQDEDYGYGYRSETYNEFDLRLRKHLSLAEESSWQRCADKLIAALPGIPKIRRPFIALLLPEKPEIANELASLESSRSSLHSKEWLKVIATDNTAVKKLERYWGLDVFSDREASYMSQENRFGYAACASLLREQGLAAVPRLAMYAHKEDCGSLLVQINHPQVIRTLLLVADKNKPSLQRVAKYSKNFPHATLAALAELLALKEPPARPGYPIIEDKKLPAQQKARDEYWRTLLQTLMASQPQLAAEVMPWLSTQARAVLNSYLSAPPKPVIDSTDNSSLPEMLVSPPWRSKKKMTAPRLDLAPLELTPQIYWQPGEQERLAATESARYFSTESLAERMEQKSGRVVLQELGFGDDVWLFLNYILPGKLDAARNSLIVQWHYYQGRVEEILNGWNSPQAQLAEQALRSGHIEALINIWENDNFSRYRPEKSVWNLYLLAQLPREMALTFWLRIIEKKHLFAGEDYFLSILGLDALPGLLLAFSHRPKETFPLILNFGATELALPVARVWRRFAAQRDLARQWILQWPEHTASALIPLVFTKPSDNSEAALLALRLLYEQGHGELLQTVANRWQRTDVWSALEQLLKQGPMDIYPARIPKAPDFWHPAMWSRPRLITNNQPVTGDALEIIGEMLRFTQGGRFYSGLEQLKTFCQPQTLAAFAWDLFTAWQQAGAPAKDNWAFLALSFDFGPRQFTVRFDENLNPVIFDQQNVRQKSVPRLRADDDQLKAPEALARLKGLKKDATQVSKNLLPRLEAALRTTRRWSLADFHSLFVNHPFTRLVTQRLIWGVYPANEPRCLLKAFRVAAEGEFCNAQDEPIDLPADALIGIAHPLEMTVEMRSEFAQLFADYEIMPPFRQLSRRTVLLTPDESTSNSLTRWEGKSATVGQLMGMRYKGWESGYEDAFVYDLGEYRLVLKFSPGFNHYNVDSKALMSFRSLRVYRDNKSVTFAELDVFDLSEALSAPDVIFH